MKKKKERIQELTKLLRKNNIKYVLNCNIIISSCELYENAYFEYGNNPPKKYRPYSKYKEVCKVLKENSDIIDIVECSECCCCGSW